MLGVKAVICAVPPDGAQMVASVAQMKNIHYFVSERASPSASQPASHPSHMPLARATGPLRQRRARAVHLHAGPAAQHLLGAHDHVRPLPRPRVHRWRAHDRRVPIHHVRVQKGTLCCAPCAPCCAFLPSPSVNHRSTRARSRVRACSPVQIQKLNLRLGVLPDQPNNRLKYNMIRTPEHTASAALPGSVRTAR
jgi:hypothetical protein